MNPEAPEGLWVKWDWPIIWWDWSFISSSKRMSLILFSAISLVLLSKFANFSDTYLEKWHWVTPSWAFEGSLRTCIQVDISSVLLDSRHRFATSWDVFEDFRERTGASSFSISGLASSLIESKDSGEELLWRSGKLSLLFPACITGTRNCRLSQ